jgi:hypothetical protein
LEVHLQPDGSDTGKFTMEEVEVKKTGSPIPMAIPFYTGMQRQSFVHQSISENNCQKQWGQWGRRHFFVDSSGAVRLDFLGSTSGLFQDHLGCK